MKRCIIAFLLLTLMLSLFVSSYAAPASSLTLNLVDSSGNITTHTAARVNATFPLQGNTDLMSYEHWAYMFTTFTTTGTFSARINDFNTFNYDGSSNRITFNLGLYCLPQMTINDPPPIYSGNMGEFYFIFNDSAPVRADVLHGYSMTTHVANMATGTQNENTTQVNYTCYTLACDIPENLRTLNRSIALDLSFDVRTFTWGSVPMHATCLTTSKDIVQFKESGDNMTFWAEIFGSVMTPEKLEENAEKSEQAESAGQQAQDAMKQDVFSGSYGSGANDFMTGSFMQILGNPLITSILPLGVALALILWGIHKGNS